MDTAIFHLVRLSPQQAQIAHTIFELSAFSIGGWLWRREYRRQSAQREDGFPTLVGCLFGAGLGNKLVAWIQMPQPLWSHGLLNIPGQSMVGGLLGGWIGVEVAKKVVGRHRSTGDAFVVPMLIGIAVGRIGCFLAGLNEATYGLPTSLPWGVDLGDGIARHPVHLYEITFVLALCFILSRLPLPRIEGLRFHLCAASYLLWRLFIDQLKPAPWRMLGLSGIQWTCLVGLGWATMRIMQLPKRLPDDATKPTA